MGKFDYFERLEAGISVYFTSAFEHFWKELGALYPNHMSHFLADLLLVRKKRWGRILSMRFV